MRPDSKLPKVGTTIFTVMSRLAAEHVACFESDRLDLAITGRDGDDRRFVYDDPTTTDEDEHVGGCEDEHEQRAQAGDQEGEGDAALLLQGALALAIMFYLGFVRVPLIARGDVHLRDIALSRSGWPLVASR